MDHLPLPRWVYVPGGDQEADHATLAGAKALVPARFEGVVPAQHPALRYGLALNDAGFFWECHQILEAIWAAAPQGGRDRILLRACIQVANVNLALKLQRKGTVVRLTGEALAALDEFCAHKAGNWGGFAGAFPANALAAALRRRLDAAASPEGPVLFEFVPRG